MGALPLMRPRIVERTFKGAACRSWAISRPRQPMCLSARTGRGFYDSAGQEYLNARPRGHPRRGPAVHGRLQQWLERKGPFRRSTAVCSAIGISERKPSRIFVRAGELPGSYLGECRLQLATELLTDPANALMSVVGSPGSLISLRKAIPPEFHGTIRHPAVGPAVRIRANFHHAAHGHVGRRQLRRRWPGAWRPWRSAGDPGSHPRGGSHFPPGESPDRA